MNEPKNKKSVGQNKKQVEAMASWETISLSDSGQSPSPPPENTRVASSAGKYYFSDEEAEFFMRYTRYMFERDPFTSNTTISVKMHKKV